MNPEEDRQMHSWWIDENGKLVHTDGMHTKHALKIRQCNLGTTEVGGNEYTYDQLWETMDPEGYEDDFVEFCKEFLEYRIPNDIFVVFGGYQHVKYRINRKNLEISSKTGDGRVYVFVPLERP